MSVARLIHRLRYFFDDAWDEWCHSPGVNLLALATLAASLFVAGLVILVLSNLDVQLRRLGDDARVQLFLRDGVADERVEALRGELAGWSGIARVEYVGKEEALRRYREWAADLAELAGELDGNPLPASLDVFLAPGPRAEETATQLAVRLADHGVVEDVRFDREWIRRLESIVEVARAGGSALGAVVFGAVILVMASVLRLAVWARRDEIEIMQLVGATAAFIRGPFLVAGLVQGLAAALLALVGVEAVRRAAWVGTGSAPAALLGLVAGQPLSAGLSALVVAVGLAVGLAGSWFAVRPPR